MAPNLTSLQNTVLVIDDGGFRANADEEKRLKEIESLLIVEEGSAMSLCSGLTDATILSIQVCIFYLYNIFEQDQHIPLNNICLCFSLSSIEI